ncbi:MAG: HAD-IA family hydrolase [Gammaproteobacteria bacterium]|nr:HAD-IA family hydrolase [Gammaproteobacteria bacterium]MCY4164674.1 HAD-IA family hydrolase [Gammaproteobacteria bacterium]
MAAAMRPVRAVLFDLDGTLADTAPDLVGCVQEVMRERGCPPRPFASLRACASQGAKGVLAAGFGEALVESPEYPEVLKQCLALYSTRLADRSRLFPGMREVLDELGRRGIRWGVVTNKPEYLTRPLLEALDVARECEVTVGGDTTARLKPHPEPMLHALRHLALDATDCIMLGDAPRDIQAAAAVGMAGLAAAWGYFPPDEDLSAWGAAAILQSPEDLLRWLSEKQAGADTSTARPELQCGGLAGSALHPRCISP